jgi:MoxR-like ATPase
MANKINVAGLNVDGKIQTLEHLFDHMHSKAAGLGQSGYLLGGDTGVGKTSFIRDFAGLLGLELVMIETPHIVEEHIIDIPFIVVKPTGQAETKHAVVDTQGSKQEFDIKFAKSNLYTTLVASNKIGDAALLQNIYRRKDLALIWEKLGGSDKKIPDEIADIRRKFKTVLFLDEYFRQASTAIRNMLRSILNGRIGSNKLPDDVYVIFASNLVDQGVGDILENEDFKMLSFDTPNLDEWFAYLITKYQGNKKVKLDDELVHDFYQLMKKHKGSLSTDDVAADVRISPRRWEQLILYINGAMPVKDQRDADLLLKNVEINFKNYIDGARAEIAKDVMDAVKELIKSRQKITPNEKSVDDSDWRETLKHQIETRIKIGNARKYIPVIGGLPGAGKTRHITDLATDLDLVPVFVDVQNLSPEEVIGTPLAKEGKAEEIEVTFSRPPLYDDIHRQMKEGAANIGARLVKFYGEEEGKKKFATWKSADVKYLIFFDELNRTNTKVFNAVRKVLLEKEFNSEYKLPEDSVIVAAINPTGKGTQELTKHVRDVFDVIPVGISWQKFKRHLDSVDLGVSDEIATISRSALNAFVEQFRVKGEKKHNVDPQFYLNVGPTPLYISGREYTDMLAGVARTTQRAYSREIKHLGEPDHDAGASELVVREAMSRAFKHSLDYIINVKHAVDAPQFMNDLDEWFKYTDKFSLGGAFKQKVESVKTLKDLLAKSFDDTNADLFNDLEFVNYVTSVDSVVFREDLTEFLVTSVVQDASKAFAAFGKRKELKGAKSKVSDEEVSKLEFVTREILHSLKLHDISNKMIEMVKLSVRDALVKIADENSDAIMDVMKFSNAINQYIKKLA